MPKEKSCGAIIFTKEDGNDVKYLLLHYEAGHWDFPKGNQEKKEKEEQTAAREIREETGIEKIKFIDDFRETIKYFYKKDGKTTYKEVVFFLAQSMTDEVKVSFEHVGFAWLGYNNAHKRLTYNNSRELLEKAKEFLERNQ